MTLPIWLIVVIGLSFIFLGYVVGVISTYASIPKLGDLVIQDFQYTDDSKGFTEQMTDIYLALNKPLGEYGNDISDNKEVLLKVRKKSTS